MKEVGRRRRRKRRSRAGRKTKEMEDKKVG
jgi:hypothetical protein